VFPALAPGIAALMAWPVLDHVPSGTELLGLLISIAGLIWTVTGKPATKPAVAAKPTPIRPHALESTP
jgi:drug/metabolite transporter (DMT)-like permease